LRLKRVKHYFALVSVVVLLITAVFAFLNLQGTYTSPPVILDPDFNLWVNGSSGPQLMVWSLEVVKGSNDQFAMNKTLMQGREATELSLFQSGVQSKWAYASLSQSLDGYRLRQLLNVTLGIWVLKEPCLCDVDPFNKTSVILSIETNDGTHTITFVFSDGLQGVSTLMDHRIVYLPTPSGAWYFEKLDIGREYRLMRWSAPEVLRLSIVFGVAGLTTGWHSAYVTGISITGNDLGFPISPQQIGESIRLRVNP